MKADIGSLSPWSADCVVTLEKKLGGASLSVPVVLPLAVFDGRRAALMKRDMRLGSNAAARSRTKRDAGTTMATLMDCRLGIGCRKREPVSVRDRHAPALRGSGSRRPDDAAHTRARSGGRARHRQGGAPCRRPAHGSSRPSPALAAQ